jgi:hypothetical protein
MKKLSKQQAFTKKLADVNKDNIQEIETSFKELKETLSKYDPIKLLSQIHLTYLLVPENEFHGEDSEQEEWLRKSEFLSGLYLSQNYPTAPKSLVDGADLEIVEKALDRYLKSITTDLLTSGSLIKKDEDKEIESILKSAKLFSFYVRGESYQHQLRDILVSLYSAHDEWFKKKLGFTIVEALSISESIISEYNDRVNLEKELSLKKAKKYIKEHPKNGDPLVDEKKYLTQVGCYYFFGESDRILSFTLKELVKFSGFSEDVCKSFLSRLSQSFGYKNPRFSNSFEKAKFASWDYNALYEKPIIEHEGKYYVPLPSLFYEVLYHTFYYDLIGDSQYWDSGGSKTYANSLEEKTAEYLERIFPKDCIFLNPEYPNGTEMCDVLVLFDRYVLVFQDKTKRMQHESLIGKNIETIKNDISKGIRSAFDQAIKAKNYLEAGKPVKIKVKKGEIIIDSRQISNIYPISVTLDSYQNFTTRFSNTNSILKVFEENKYPWSVSLSNLGTITEIINSPEQFLHYISRRLTIEKTTFHLMADEIDLLGLYLSRGIYFEDGEFDKYNAASFSGVSEEIDKYIFEKHETSLNPSLPHQKSPDGFDDYLPAIAQLGTPYRTDCSMRLLDLGYKGRENFVKSVESLKNKVRSGKELESFSFVLDEKPSGYCFIGMDTGNNQEKLYRQLYSFAVMKKYSTKCKEWVAFGWDKNSDRLVDLAIFLSFDWVEDEVVEKISKQFLKPGKMVDLSKD